MSHSLLAAIEINPILWQLVILTFALVCIGLLFRIIRQPYIIAYIIAGVLLGPQGMAIVEDEELIEELGSIGLILLLFFIGMEFSLRDLIANWKISLYGTVLQILISVLVIFGVGYYLGWPANRMLLFGFVISLSSTAVVIKLLQDSGEIHSRLGQNVVGILLAQDILIVPMVIIVNYMGGSEMQTGDLIEQILGGIAIIGLVIWLVRKQTIKLPFNSYISKDHELQVFVSLAVCLGFAIFTGLLHLSTALGAFIGGIFVSAAQSTEWFHDNLHGFRVLFVALFFLSIGLAIDLVFVRENISVILVLVVTVFVLNNVINALVMRIFGQSRRDSILAGAILAQIGEFSFVLGATAYAASMIDVHGYQMIISVISLSLLLSPFWIALIKLVFKLKPLDRKGNDPRAN